MLSQTNPSATPPSPATVDCLFGFTGRPLDTATGLQFNGGDGQVGRWYDAITGRWLKPDSGGLGPDVNPYRYVGNGPTNRIDPLGFQASAAGPNSRQPYWQQNADGSWTYNHYVPGLGWSQSHSTVPPSQNRPRQQNPCPDDQPAPPTRSPDYQPNPNYQPIPGFPQATGPAGWVPSWLTPFMGGPPVTYTDPNTGVQYHVGGHASWDTGGEKQALPPLFGIPKWGADACISFPLEPVKKKKSR
jgi:RHS repeat-associated protein